MVNKTILELEQVFTSHTHGETIELLNELVSLRNEISNIMNSMIEQNNDLCDELLSDEISEMELQIVYLNHNIMTIKDAIMLHESKTFEKKSSKNGIATFCLN